jgi:hypothetical protein
MKSRLVWLEGVPGIGMRVIEGSKSRLLMCLIVGFCRREAPALSARADCVLISNRLPTTSEEGSFLFMYQLL